MSSKAIVADIVSLLSAEANPEDAVAIEAYLKNQFPCLGIKIPARRALLKELWHTRSLPTISGLPSVARALYNLPQREYHHTSMELCHQLRKQWTGTELPLFEHLILNHSWWDTVDFIATKLLAEYFLKFPEQKQKAIARYLASGNLWLRRSAIIFQNPYKKRTDEALLFTAIRSCSSDKDFFLRKAIGWALREYAKTRPERVIDFVESESLSPLSKREALKHLAAII